MRLLDVGCGWGGMVMHAAQHYGVRALGVTLSRRQAEWAQKAIAEAGLTELAEVRHLDYRDVAESDFDAISSIGLTEHIGLSQLRVVLPVPASASCGPGGRLLNHCITLPTNRDAVKDDWFIRRYVFPDGELTGVGRIVVDDAGRRPRGPARGEPARALRADHRGLVGTTSTRTGTRRWPRSAWARPGCGGSTWPASASASTENKIQLHQVLGVKLHSSGAADFPLRPDW